MKYMTPDKAHDKMRDDAYDKIVETLEGGYSGYYCDLHNECFNTDYYIIGRHEAEDFLNQYGVFTAIDKVRSYEHDNFGEVTTDLSDPEKLVNMLFYIIGEEIVDDMFSGIDALSDNWNDEADEETNKLIQTAMREQRI